MSVYHVGIAWAIPLVLIRTIARDPLGLWVLLGMQFSASQVKPHRPSGFRAIALIKTEGITQAITNLEMLLGYRWVTSGLM